MKAVAYMLDTEIWERYAGSNAEYAIGGPTLEILYRSYNTYKKLTGESKLIATAEGSNGYKYDNVSFDSDTNEKDNPYSTRSVGGSCAGYFIASPNNSSEQLQIVSSSGNGIGGASYYSSAGYALRPVVCLNSTCRLEKTIIDGAEYLKIINM